MTVSASPLLGAAMIAYHLLGAVMLSYPLLGTVMMASPLVGAVMMASLLDCSGMTASPLVGAAVAEVGVISLVAAALVDGGAVPEKPVWQVLPQLLPRLSHHSQNLIDPLQSLPHKDD